MRTFITKCIVGDFLTEGEGNGKKVSKESFQTNYSSYFLKSLNILKKNDFLVKIKLFCIYKDFLQFVHFDPLSVNVDFHNFVSMLV